MDQANLLSPKQKEIIHNKIMNLEREKGSQIAVLIIPTLNGEDIVSYGVRVMEKWKLGSKDVDDGLLLIVALNDRQMRIEVGYGLEGVIPDIVAKSIINNYMVPYFKKGDFYSGINSSVDALINRINKEAFSTKKEFFPSKNEPPATKSSKYLIIMGLLALLVICVFIWKIIVDTVILPLITEVKSRALSCH